MNPVSLQQLSSTTLSTNLDQLLISNISTDQLAYVEPLNHLRGQLKNKIQDLNITDAVNIYFSTKDEIANLYPNTDTSPTLVAIITGIEVIIGRSVPSIEMIRQILRIGGPWAGDKIVHMIIRRGINNFKADWINVWSNFDQLKSMIKSTIHNMLNEFQPFYFGIVRIYQGHVIESNYGYYRTAEATSTIVFFSITDYPSTPNVYERDVSGTVIKSYSIFPSNRDFIWKLAIKNQLVYVVNGGYLFVRLTNDEYPQIGPWKLQFRSKDDPETIEDGIYYPTMYWTEEYRFAIEFTLN